jgi:hypothetical protein
MTEVHCTTTTAKTIISRRWFMYRDNMKNGPLTGYWIGTVALIPAFRPAVLFLGLLFFLLPGCGEGKKTEEDSAVDTDAPDGQELIELAEVIDGEAIDSAHETADAADLPDIGNGRIPAPRWLCAAPHSSGKTSLSWRLDEAHAGTISGYRVYRNGDFLTEVSSTSYIDDTAANGETYTWAHSNFMALSHNPLFLSVF